MRLRLPDLDVLFTPKSEKVSRAQKFEAGLENIPVKSLLRRDLQGISSS